MVGLNIMSTLQPQLQKQKQQQQQQQQQQLQKRRKKTQRQILISETGEEFGLVPMKYLKRKATLTASEGKDGLLVSSLAEPSTGGTPPRKTYDDDTTAAEEPPEGVAAAVGAPPAATAASATAGASSSLPPPTPSRLFQTEPAPKVDATTISSSSSEPILKDTTPLSVTYKDASERTEALNQLNQSLKQRGFPSSMIGTSAFVEDWKLTVLRAEGYTNIAKAATRVMHHWRLKSELFGTPDLKVTMKDVAPNLVESGMIQVVPTRDLAGRAIVCMNFNPKVYANQEREIRKYLFYMLTSVLEDEETQDRGLVLAVWNDSSSSQQQEQGLNPFLNAAASSSSWAGGVMSSLFDSFWNLWKSIKSSFHIARLHYIKIDPNGTYSCKEYEDHDTIIRHHSGSPQECLHGLLTYGLPLPALPISAATGWQVGLYTLWVEWRQCTDSYHHQQHYPIVLVPTRQDILFGKHAVINAGNVKFHQMILANVEEYKVATTKEQSTMCHQLYQSFTSNNDNIRCRCLQPLDARLGTLWEPMKEKDAINKIADAFEFVIRQQESQENDGISSSNGLSLSKNKSLSLDPHGDWDFMGIKSCCFILTPGQDGYTFCGGGGNKNNVASSPVKY